MSQCGSWESEKLPRGGDPLEEHCVCRVSRGQGRRGGELSPSLGREEESKPAQRESSLANSRRTLEQTRRTETKFPNAGKFTHRQLSAE